MKRETLKEHPTTICPRCHGAARIQISEELVAALKIVIGRKVTSIEVAEELSIKGTAANNRLETLRNLGLIKRKWRKQTHTWVYFAVNGGLA